MIKENVLEIKKLVSDLHCMGTYGMVELELTKVENYVKELEGKVKNLTIPVVSNAVCYNTNCNFCTDHKCTMYADRMKECIYRQTDC